MLDNTGVIGGSDRRWGSESAQWESLSESMEN